MQIKKVVWNKGKPYLKLRGKNNPNWKGGITGWDQTERTRIEFKLWRKKVFELNPHKCFTCGRSKFLIAHHLKSFKDYPDLRYDPKNGIIVCRRCHPSIHKFGLDYVLENPFAIRKCLTCGKKIIAPISRLKTNFYCSRKCWHKRPSRQTHEQRLEYKRNWYQRNKDKPYFRKKKYALSSNYIR